MNKKQLLQDITFPLRWGTETYKQYIFDANNNIIAQRDDDHDNKIPPSTVKFPFDKLLGDYKESSPTKEIYYAYKGDIFTVKGNNQIGLVRNWGTLRNKYNEQEAMERQNNILAYIINILNS